MEETIEKPGMFARLTGWIHRDEDDYEDHHDEEAPTPRLHINAVKHYQITVRRQILSFSDAVAAADGLKSGQQQILNLSATPPDLREKIKDFMCGVNYTAEGSWEELGQHVYLLAPASANVEVASANPRHRNQRNSPN